MNSAKVEIYDTTLRDGSQQVLAEFGTPLLLTDGAVNEIAPVNGSLRCVPSMGSLTFSIRVHRPAAGVPRKNCMVGSIPRKPHAIG
jgi:hypothetical protein